MLSGQRPQDAPWWPDYVDHTKRRNAIVHHGLDITREDAVASIEATLELRNWLLELRQAAVDART